MRKLLILGGLVACTPQTQAYYVANVYQANSQLFVQKCDLDSTRHGDVANPDSCKIIPIGELPPSAVVVKGVDSEGNPAPATPPAAPPPPREPTPVGVPNSPPLEN